jgi:3-dehydroquinate synthase
MQTIRVQLGPRSYDIAIGSDVENDFAAFVQDRCPSGARPLVVTDTNTLPHAARMAARLPAAEVIAVPAGEGSKSLDQFGQLCTHLARLKSDRQTPVIAVGGGVVGDLAGYVAASYSRGLPLLMVPTTLLAMVDSSVGGKVGINLPEGKNLVGAFHQPAGVWIDTSLLDTLPDREYRSGLAEVVKYGMILDAGFFAWLEANADAVLRREPAAVMHVVGRSCQLKADVVEKDEREETGLRMILNYGHTFAHAFESVGGYGVWLHGEAVAAGMIHASMLAERRNLIPRELTDRQIGLLTRFGLPRQRLPDWGVDDLLAVMKRDKKNVRGNLRFILPLRIGQVAAFDDVPESLVREVLAAI